MTNMDTERPYVEYGTAEGFIQSIASDGHNRALLMLKHRLSGDSVKCVITGRVLQIIGHHEADEVFKGLRVRITGMIDYNAIGRIAQIQAENLEFPRARSELPIAEDIFDEGFTGGLQSEGYLERLRDG